MLGRGARHKGVCAFSGAPTPGRDALAQVPRLSAAGAPPALDRAGGVPRDELCLQARKVVGGGPALLIGVSGACGRDACLVLSAGRRGARLPQPCLGLGWVGQGRLPAHPGEAEWLEQAGQDRPGRPETQPPT